MKSLTGTTAILVYLGLSDFVAHIIFASNYGYFRDELYYIVSGTQHLSLGYVDFPPMIAYVAALLGMFTKDSLISIHVVPALAQSLIVVVTGMTARELGGEKRAQLLAAISALATLGFLAEGSVFSPDSLDQLWWSLLAYLTIRAIRRGAPKVWLVAGIVFGLALLTKLTVAFFGGAMLIGLLAFSSSRMRLRSRWVVAGAAASTLLVLPMVFWNLANGWPMVHFYLEFRGDVSGGGPLDFLINQVDLLTLLNVPIVVAGAYFYLRSSAGRELRALGLAFVILYVFMTAIDAKPYYLLGVYPMMFAGGALFVERSSVSKRGMSRWFGSRPYVASVVVIALVLTPLTMPILPPPTLVSVYGNSIGLTNGAAGQPNAGPLPQVLGDRFGWNTMVVALANATRSLPASERSQACIFTTDYGQASAVNFLGRGQGLPPAISGHNNYYIWGPGSCTGQVLITVGPSLSYFQGNFTAFEEGYVNGTLKVAYKDVTLLTIIRCEYCMNSENNVPVYLCTNPTFTSIATVWPGVRHYD
jgi:hypothetical protein